MNTQILAVCAAVVIIVQGAPYSRLNDQVSYYEPLHFEKHHVMRRSAVTGSMQLHTTSFDVQFSAFNRDFKVDLKPETKLFHNDAVIKVHTDDGSFEHTIDDRQYYKGKVNGDAKSFCHMRVAQDGSIRGFFNYQGEKYAIDPASEHFADEQEFNHVIYRLSDHDYVQHQDEMPPVTCGAKQPDVEFDEVSGQRQRRAATAYTQGNVVCGVALVVDSKFYSTLGGSDLSATIDMITSRFADVKEIYDDNGIHIDSDPEAMTIAIAFLEVQTSTASDPYNPQDWNEEGDEFLKHVSTDPNQASRGTPFDDYCLVHVFTNQEFSGGLLGLAWVGSATSIGGVCQEGGTVGGEFVYYNTGFSTQTNFGQTVPSLTVTLVMTHELGHNFGSQHDSEEQTSNGEFIMWPVSVDGSGSNNFIFSTQSVSSFQTVIGAKGGCMIDSSEPFCGNNVQEGDEDCDCGVSGDLCDELDSCCAASCSLAAGSQCSPLHSDNGGCCDDGCQLITDNSHECRAATECRLAQTCSAGGECLPSTNVDDNTQCADTAALLCGSGECSVSVCSLWGFDETLDAASDADVCVVHCDDNGTAKKTNNLGPASPAGKDVNGTDIDFENIDPVFKAVGAICRRPSDDFTGVCDENHDCVSAGGEVLLDDLEDFLRNLDFAAIKGWFLGPGPLGVPIYGWFAIAFGVLLILIMTCCCISNKCDKAKGIH